MKKDLELWYSRLEPRGKIILGLAVVGLIWLLVQLGLAIAGISLGLGIFGFILNLIAMTLISLIAAQFFMMRKMQRDYEANYREMMVRGRKGGSKMEQISGRRDRGSMRRSGGGADMSQAVQMMTSVSVDNLDKHYRPKPIARPTIIDDWKEITEGGLYALSSAPKEKVEVIDASDIGGGFFVGKYSGKYVQERILMTHNSTGEPLRFSTLRNAKQALAGKAVKMGSGGTKKKKPKRKNAKKRA